MSVKHHIGDDFLIDYASGRLSEGWSLAVASHLALCPECRGRLAAMEGAAGVLLDKLSPQLDAEAGSEDDAWARFRAKALDIKVEEIAPRVQRASAPTVIPEPLRSYVGGDLADLKWRALGRGAYQILIDTGDRETQVRLLRIPAGKPVPEHTHEGRELTLVLSGSFRDRDDLFARGDIEEADGDLLHTPHATEGEDCICLAVTEAPLKFSSWIVRLMQPILKI
ncbi:ChrR family anti-sigma-E factor [Neorhizobium sp. NCHU2750]|uniref:ChrR family anti-sigma-E factor n=1 Tax=Neorhizobium sp. NCHU2750 TaxID=1825976 RepID=UPI000E72E766|nr:transcriptional regulator [Neorhizobium sp. NCHU2750]